MTVRVLHVGNIANNAYLNAKILNEAGVESDVLSYGHYQLMGFPEWEDSDFSGPVLDEDRPDWRQMDMNGFTRPCWFAQGPFSAAAAYLNARRGGSRSRARAAWRMLEFRRDLICGSRWRWARAARAAVRRPRASPSPGPPALTEGAGNDDRRLADDIAAYGRDHGWTRSGLRRLFGHYDLVHAYGAEPILPWLADAHPYIAFEHGTIRALPFEDSPVGRLTSRAYREADIVLITNADNRAAAERLGLKRYRFIPHPVSEYRPDAEAVAALRARLMRELSADFIVLHPSRHHWEPERRPHWEKGNDRLIDGLAAFFAERPQAAAVFVDWGQTAEASRARLAERGIADRVSWIPPQSGPSLARHMAAADVVADQFFLGAFGGITPRALFLGTPALLYLDADAHRWCFPELPPVINARDAEDVAAQLTRAYDRPDWRADLGRLGEQWYARYHANAVVRRELIDVYRELTSPHGP